MQSVKFQLGKPHHGWLPFDINFGNFSFSDEASDLGLNAIDQLIDMVSNLKAKQESECYFYLEPGVYFLKTRPNESTTILKVQFLDDFDLDKNQIPKTLFESEFNTNELTNALIEALIVFRQMEYQESDWPKPEKSEILNSLS